MSEHTHKIPTNKRGKVMSEHAHNICTGKLLEKREGKSRVPEHALKKSTRFFCEHAQTCFPSLFFQLLVCF